MNEEGIDTARLFRKAGLEENQQHSFSTRPQSATLNKPQSSEMNRSTTTPSAVSTTLPAGYTTGDEKIGQELAPEAPKDAPEPTGDPKKGPAVSDAEDKESIEMLRSDLNNYLTT